MNHSTIARTVARGIRSPVVAAVAVLLAGLLAVTQPVRAATYAVTNTNNSGPGSLRQAITDANTNPGPDTITFAAATNGDPIVLAGLANEDLNASGDLDILGGGGDLTIQGNGAANTIVDGGGTDRVFHVCPGGGCANTVIFNGVTIQNGKPPSPGGGGGLFNVGSTTMVDGSTVSANTAFSGGGILNLATLNVTNSTIGGVGAGNQATVWGGGIFNDGGGTTTVDGSTVSANTAVYGGGIYNSTGTTTVDGSTVSANTAYQGGGIYNWAGTTTVNGSAVSANTAVYGGGIINEATLNVTNSTIGGAGAGNQATVWGGGIFNDGGGTTTVDGSTVSANTAKNGGGMFNYGTLNVTNSTIGGAGAGNQATIWGGGIYNDIGSTRVTGSCILNNWATINGGGLYNDEDSFAATNVTGSSIVGNSATSFLNNEDSEQWAAGNWWGAATGPNRPGADTVDGNVDTSGYLTKPIPDCLLHVYLPVLRQTP